jgi:hypothetical protein
MVVRRGREPEPFMIEFSVSFIEFVLATFIPIYVGTCLLIFLSNATNVDIRYLSAYALGLLFWFFFDTLNDAVQLDVNQGYSFDFNHVGLVALFIIGFLIFTLLGGLLSTSERNSSATGQGKSSAFTLTVLVALAMGCHGIGEGIEFGGLSAGTQATSVLDAIGGMSGGIAYGLHKLLESTIVIIVFIALARASGLPFRKQFWQTVMVAFTFGIPSAVGEVAGYFIPIDSSWFFALGAGAALFVVLQVIRPIFTLNTGEVTYSQWLRISTAMILGFLLLYAAALFHS